MNSYILIIPVELHVQWDTGDLMKPEDVKPVMKPVELVMVMIHGIVILVTSQELYLTDIVLKNVMLVCSWLKLVTVYQMMTVDVANIVILLVKLVTT
jgi:hypothetical protein